jgi:hypothetical protein
METALYVLLAFGAGLALRPWLWALAATLDKDEAEP